MKYRLFAGLAAGLLVALPARTQQPSVLGEPAVAPKSAALAHLRLDDRVPALAVTLGRVTDAEVDAVRQRNSARSRAPREPQAQRLAIGIARVPSSASAAALAWKRVAGGHAARLAVTSPEAAALRVAIDLAGVPPEVEMVFFGSMTPSRLEGPVRVGDIADRTQAWWSPLTEGETQTVELFVPERFDPATLPLSVAGASHVFTTPSSGFTKRIQDIGLAGACNVDVPCSPLASNVAFRNAAESVAQMVFNDAGFTTLCTGTLLADGDTGTQTPWFYSANHCFENEDPPYKTAAQMQAVANTLTTLWGFEATTCGSRTPRSGWSQLAGGATFLYNNAASDVLFLRLNAAPPGGAYYSGWDANALAIGNALAGLHHPHGDLKKASEGSVVGFPTIGVGGGNASFTQVRWTSGTTEVGSSGSGIFLASAGQYLFRGGLWGGSAACDTPSGTDYFSRFDQVYAALAPYLGTSAAPAVDYTDLWWNPNEAGWGLSLTQHPSRVIFGVWYTYELDGTRTWYVMPGGVWTSANTYAGTLYTTAGPAFNTSFHPGQVEQRQVGSATLTFSGANNGVFTYSIDGVSGSKSITRQPF